MSREGFNEALVADATPSLTKREIERPVPGANQLLVKISHVAQNPTDGSCDPSFSRPDR
jgi:NADPH:quinone reductase-like Zn-dependent oxidoreductase